jgi:hypothetical protein
MLDFGSLLINSPPSNSDGGGAEAHGLFVDGLTDLMRRQDDFYRSIGQDPNAISIVTPIWIRYNTEIASRPWLKGVGKISFVPGRSFLEQCLGFRAVKWRDFTVKDSLLGARFRGDAVAYLIGDRVYFEGKPITGHLGKCGSSLNAKG